ncbi:putative ammonium transporter 3 [Hyalella azteca]|uniref:Ammonium transporter 3 n=1 Tax=Hyalella azteca TaxID=294128 RepID=A0A979FX63_HYAAZ|nr:putative ammonium transporter 3 [Hyalella azteca]
MTVFKFMNNTSISFNETHYEYNGTWSWLPHLNLTGNRGGGVIHQTPQDSSKVPLDDAAWVLTATFIIFTMQSGFGLLEGGCVSIKNETNIMVKNVVDVVLGGITYWMFGYGLSFGTARGSNPLFGWGSFFLNADEDTMGDVYTTFFFQLSFATTATTVVSGAIAESINFSPRLGRYDHSDAPLPMGSPTTAILGMFMLWWGWLGFNCGSTFGIRGHKWKYAARTAVTTIQASIGGGLMGMSISWFKNRQLEIGDVVNSILGALVSITAGCALFTTFEALLVGMVGGAIAVLTMPLVDKIHVDDPVGATSVHGLCGIWAMLAIGLFVKADTLLGMTHGRSGLFRGGGFYLLGIQALACVVVMLWSTSVTFILLKLIDKLMVPIRMSEWEELVGADFAEHGFRRRGAGITRATSVLGFQHHGHDYSTIPVQGDNPCHVSVLQRLEDLQSRRGSTLSGALAQVTRLHAVTRKIKDRFVRKQGAKTEDSLTANFIQDTDENAVESLPSSARSNRRIGTARTSPMSAGAARRAWFVDD